jgi:hypothetical protein
MAGARRQGKSPLFEIASVLARLDHVATTLPKETDPVPSSD